MARKTGRIIKNGISNNAPPFFKKVRNLAIVLFVVTMILLPDKTFLSFTEDIKRPFYLPAVFEEWIRYIRWALSLIAGGAHWTNQ